jgi:hypothetical protein
LEALLNLVAVSRNPDRGNPASIPVAKVREVTFVIDVSIEAAYEATLRSSHTFGILVGKREGIGSVQTVEPRQDWKVV